MREEEREPWEGSETLPSSEPLDAGRSNKLVVMAWTMVAALCAGVCFLGLCSRADTMEQLEDQKGLVLPLYVGTAAMLVGMIRLMLGEGREQKATLKRMVRSLIPDIKKSSVLPQESLLRVSSPPQAPREPLLRPVKETMETAPEQLLRASHKE